MTTHQALQAVLAATERGVTFTLHAPGPDQLLRITARRDGWQQTTCASHNALNTLVDPADALLQLMASCLQPKHPGEPML